MIIFNEMSRPHVIMVLHGSLLSSSYEEIQQFIKDVKGMLCHSTNISSGDDTTKINAFWKILKRQTFMLIEI